MQIDLSIDPVGARAADIVATAVEAEKLGFGGVTLIDELCDYTGNGAWSHEPWTLLSGIAAATKTINLGTLALNVANRDPETFAVAVATLQDLSSGRLWVGLGAGTDASSPFSLDQRAFGRAPAGAAARREKLREHVARIRAVWANTDAGFATPSPAVPLIVAAFGPKTSAVAGEAADGIAAPIDAYGNHGEPIESLAATAKQAFSASGRSGKFRVIAHCALGCQIEDPRWQAGSDLLARLDAAGVDRLVLDTPADPDRLRKASVAMPVSTG